MKPVAIISDIHANLPALTAVLEDIDKHGIEELGWMGVHTARGSDRQRSGVQVEEAGGRDGVDGFCQMN